MASIVDIWVRRVAARESAVGLGESADFVHIRIDTGATGHWGPISPVQTCLILGVLRARMIGATVDRAAAALAAARAERHTGGYFSMACCACDLALWDLKGKEANTPVWKLFGPTKRESLACYVSLLGYDIFESGSHDDLGNFGELYWGVKWAARLGTAVGAAGISSTVDALEKIRRRDRGRMMVDALGNWTLDHAVAFLAAAEPLALDWLEEPVPPNDLGAYRRLTRMAQTRIAAGEHAYSLLDMKNLIDCGVRVLQPDASWCGGLMEFDEMLRAAQAAGCSVFPHGSGLLPALHVCLSYPTETVPALEYHYTMEPRRQRFWAEKFVPHAGSLAAPTRPGLGVRIDETILASSIDLRAVPQEAS